MTVCNCKVVRQLNRLCLFVFIIFFFHLFIFILLNRTLLADPKTPVELQMNIMTEEYQFPFTGEGFSSSVELQALITEMGSVESGCSNKQCQATFNQTETEA